MLAVAILMLYIYAIVDLARSPARDVRLLPKWLWVIVVVLVVIAGPALYLALGRPLVGYPPSGGDGGGGSGGRGGPGPRGPVAPDDDPEFLKKLDEQSWSARMEQLRREREGGGSPTGDEDSTPSA